MTMQASDCVLHEGEDFTILSRSPGVLFFPEQVGISVVSLCTSVLRGFLCTYEIKYGELSLNTLYIRAKGGLYPLINGSPPSFPYGYVEGGDCAASYKDIGLPLHYTGVLRLGRDQDRSFYVSIGPFHWMFRRVLDVTIVDGHVQSVSDISAEMAEIRNQQPESATCKGRMERMLKENAEMEKRWRKPN